MPIVQAKCENCGGVLAVDNSQKAAVCPFCNTPYVVQDAINNYNITNNVNVGAGANVTVYGSVNGDFEIVANVLKSYKGSADNVVIPKTVKEIGDNAFQGLAITSVTIPDSVTSIGNKAFYGCKSLTSITIPNGVTRIGNSTFEKCYSLTSIILYNSITEIGDRAFYWCSSLKNIIIPNRFTTFLIDYDELDPPSVNIPNSVTYISDSAFYGCSSLTSVTIPDGVTSIGNEAFRRCSSLTSVNIPDSVKYIGEYSFSECSSLTSIFIPDSVTRIGRSAFWQCESLTSISIPDSVTEIGTNAFFLCKSFPKTRQSKEAVKKKSGGCYVATAVYGSYDCPEVWTLRRYRDYRLDSTWYGRLFIMLYYAISPTIVKWFGETAWFKKLWRGKLDRMVEKLQNEGYESTPYNDKY